MFSSLIAREWRAVAQRPQQILNPLAFLLLAVMLFSIARGPSAGPAQDGHAAALWVVVLLTSILSLDTLFRRDFDNGMLEQMLLTVPAPFLAVLVRIGVQWCYSGLLIALLAPGLGFLMSVPADALGTLTLALLIGTPALSLLGAMGAALTVGFSRGGVVLALLVLPLFVPVLIFGAGATAAAMRGESASAELAWLGFISMLALSIGPFAATAGLRISVQLQ